MDVSARCVVRSGDPYWREPEPLPEWHRMGYGKQLAVIAAWTFVVISVVRLWFDV